MTNDGESHTVYASRALRPLRVVCACSPLALTVHYGTGTVIPADFALLPSLLLCETLASLLSTSTAGTLD